MISFTQDGEIHLAVPCLTLTKVSSGVDQSASFWKVLPNLVTYSNIKSLGDKRWKKDTKKPLQNVVLSQLIILTRRICDECFQNLPFSKTCMLLLPFLILFQINFFINSVDKRSSKHELLSFTQSTMMSNSVWQNLKLIQLLNY